MPPSPARLPSPPSFVPPSTCTRALTVTGQCPVLLRFGRGDGAAGGCVCGYGGGSEQRLDSRPGCGD
eukprot:366134-Chlamydomonas_euryale.AAC.12